MCAIRTVVHAPERMCRSNKKHMISCSAVSSLTSTPGPPVTASDTYGVLVRPSISSKKIIKIHVYTMTCARSISVKQTHAFILPKFNAVLIV